jgi:hypothetical protein
MILELSPFVVILSGVACVIAFSSRSEDARRSRRICFYLWVRFLSAAVFHGVGASAPAKNPRARRLPLRSFSRSKFCGWAFFLPMNVAR